MAIVVCTANVSAGGQAQAEQIAPDTWTWTDGAAQTRTRADLTQLVAQHGLWLTTGGLQGARADLTGAKLVGARLQMANLRDANLRAADLSHTDFTIVDLTGADLRGITLVEARWRGVTLVRANLSGAFIQQTEMGWTQMQMATLSNASVLGSALNDSSLKGAILDHTSFVGGTLENAQLDDVDLRFGGLLKTNLAGASFSGADLGDSAYEPSQPPELRGIANAHHLERLRFLTSPDALTALRQAFVAGGYTEQRNKLTYALKRQENVLRWRRAQDGTCGEPGCRTERLLGRECNKGECQGDWRNYFYYGLNLIFFDWTVRYGMAPEHALVLLLQQGVFFALIYAGFLHVSRRSNLILVKRRTREPESFKRIRYRLRKIPPSTGWRYRRNLLMREWHVARISLFFSLLNTFHSGFNEVDPGKWIHLLTKHDYNFEAERWLRTVAGVQTVLSLFLFAMWLLTQFGHPFDA